MTIKEYIKQHNKKSPYLGFANNYITQFGDEGIINQLLNELNLKNNGNLVSEFGAWDGVYLSNVYKLWRYQEFNSILIESNVSRFNELRTIENKYKNIETHGVMVSPVNDNQNSFDSIVNRSRFEVTDDNFALLCIDVDGPDYNIWNSITKYKPIIIVIEIAGGWGPEQEYVGVGASLKSLNILGVAKGYTLVCATGNAYFIRNDRVSDLENYDNTATYVDYHIDDDMINNVLATLDENGEITGDIRFLQSFYDDIVKKEKDNL